MGLLNDRYKRLKGGEEEKKEEGVLNQRAQGIYTSREAANYDEEERREYEGDGSIRNRSERATSAYDLALKMLQDDEDYNNSLEGRAGIGANEHSWKSTMQSIYANAGLKNSKETIDSKLGAGATDLLRTAVNGTAIEAQRNAHIVNQKSKLYKEFGGYDNYQQALANAPTPEAATKRKESYQSDLDEIDRLNTAISEREKAGPTNYKTVSYPAWGGEGMIDVREPDNSDLDEMKKQRDRLLKKTRSYEQKQKKQDEALIGTPTGEMAYLRPDLLEIDENDPLERYLRVSGRNVGTPSAKQEKALNKLLGTEEYNETQRPQTLSAEPDFDALSGISPTENAKRTQESETPWADKDTTAYDTRPAGEPNPLDFTDSKGQFADKLAEEKGNDNAWSELTDEEIRYYRSLKNTSGDAAAETWLAGMKAVLNKRRVDRENQAYQEFKNNMPWYGRIPFDLVETAATVIAKPFGDMAAFADYVTDWITGDDDPNDILNAGQIMVSRSRARTASDLNKIFNVNVGAFDFGLGDVYQAFVSGADSLWGRTLSSAANLPGDTYTYVMAAGAAAEKRRDMWGEGADDWQVFTSSLAAGLIEWATEKISYDVFAKNFLERKPGSPWEWIAKSGLSGTIEGTEEFHGNVLNRAVNDAVMGANSDTQLAIDKYMSEGKTHDEAVMLVLGDDVAADIKDFLAGFLSMGPNIGSTVSGAISEHNQAVQTGSDIISSNAQDILRAAAQDMVSAGSETEVEKSAAKRNVKQALNRFENKPTAANTGYLANTVENAIDQGYGNPETAIKAGMNIMRSLEPTTDIRTAETSDGQTVTINEDNPIARFENGKAILNTSNGEMSVDDLSFADDSARLAYDNVNTYDVETANAVLNNYQSGDIARYLAGMREGIELHGKMNVPSEAVSYYSTLSEENQRYARTLGQTMRETIVNKAVQAAKTGTVAEFKPDSDMRKVYEGKAKGAFGTKGAVYLLNDIGEDVAHFGENYDYLEAVADTTGAPVVFYDSNTVKNEQLKNANGKYVWKNGAIYVDFNAGPVNGKKGLVAFALSHELTHFAEQWSPEDYKTYADWLVSTYSGKGGSMESLVKARMASEGTDYEEAYHDVIADFSERMLLDSDVLEKLEALREKDKTVWQKIVDKIRTLVNRIIGAYGDENQTYESNAIQDLLNSEELQKMKELWSTAVVEGAKNRAAAVQRSENTFTDPTTGEDVRWSRRTKEPPKNTMIGYKVFVVKDGKLYPPMVANPGGTDTPVGVWLDADVGERAPDSKTGRMQVKAGGKGTQGGSGSLAFRPGWHLGEVPLATQFDRVNPETGNKELFPANFVWAECEIAADRNYQDEAMSYGYTKNGKFQHSLAGLPKLPVDGYYQYRTNPNPNTVPWLITGSMKVNRLLSDAEVNDILAEKGLSPKMRQGGNKTLEELGLGKYEDVKRTEEKTTREKDRYSRKTDVQSEINQSMTMERAKQMIQRAFVNAGINNFSDGKYKNGDEWLNGEGVDDVALVIDNDYTLYKAYLESLQGIIDGDFASEDIIKAYQNGTLTGKQRAVREKADLSSSMAVSDGRFYAPKKIADAKRTFDIANGRMTKANEKEVMAARAEILLYAHNKGAAETLGLTEAELNKKLRSWSAYRADGRKFSQRINEGVQESNRWTGIENSAYIMRANITREDVERMVGNIEGDSDGFQNKYIARTMLALDTHIDWTWLNFKFDTRAGVNEGRTDKCSGYYSDQERLIHVTRNEANTVAHEMGHALDYQWARDLGVGGTLSEISATDSRIPEGARDWFDRFHDFCETLVDSSDISSEYMGRIRETFARFVDKFVGWTEQLATGRTTQDRSWYSDKFTGSQYVQFARLLQEKAALDANGVTGNVVKEQFSRKISPSDSARYLDLAKDPAKNEAELDRMVEQAAVEWGALTDESGNPLQLYHGTRDFGFTVFGNPQKVGYFFTNRLEVASTYSGKESVNQVSKKVRKNKYGERRGNYAAYIKSQNLLTVDCKFRNWDDIAIDGREVDRTDGKFYGLEVTNDTRYGFNDFTTTDNIVAFAKENGYDGVLFKNLRDNSNQNPRYRSVIEGGKGEKLGTSNVYAVFEPSQIKSADPVTYDDQGNVIPLEERFNPQNEDIRYSYKGRRSLYKPGMELRVDGIRDQRERDALNLAYIMDRNGEDSEKIRLATGWFKGYDGVWRSEINDSEAKLADWVILGKGKLYMEEKAQKNTGELWDKMFALKNRLAKSNKVNGAKSDESKALRKEIRETRKQLEETRELEYRIWQNRLLLPDILDHPKLYENYPQLKDAIVHLSYTDREDLRGAWGSTVLGSDEITLATNLNSREEVLETLMHEIQHVIQGIEGFASGANVEYWARRNKSESEDTRKAKLKLANVEGKLMNVEYSGNDSASPIKTAMSYAYIIDQLRKDKKGTANYEYDTEAKARYEERAKEGGYADLLKEYLEAYQDVQIATMQAEDYTKAFADYQRTAGEIEARDVSHRLRMTDEERRANRPDIDRKDVLFYDSDRLSRKQATSYSTRAVVERALKTLPEGAEKKALTEYKQTLDSYDAERMAYNAAVQAGDRDNITRAKNNMQTLSAKLERMENGKSLQNIAAVKDVKALNEDAKDLREMLRAQATETGGTVASKASAKLAADTLAERYNITKGKGELADLISELYTEVMTGVNNGAYNREQILDMARSVSEWIDEKQNEERRKNRQEDPEVRDVLNYIKGSRVRINENQKGDIRSRYDGKLIKWMGKLSGYVRVANNATMTLDDLWGDLSKQYPHIFDATISDADEGIMLADIISDLKSRRYIEEEEYDPTREEYEEHINGISEEVVNALWEVKPQLTIADRYAKKIESLREKHRERMRETRRTFEQTIREQREASWQRGKEVAEARQKRRELRTRIKALMTNLSNRLVNPKVGKYVPMNLQQPVAEVLSMIDTDTGRSERASAKLSALYFAYENIKNDPKYAAYRNVYDPAVSEMMRRVTTAVTEMEKVNAKYGRTGIYSRETEKGKSTGTVDTQLSIRLLENLYEALKQFDTVIKDSVNIHGLGSAIDETLSTQDVGQKLIEEVRTENKRKSELRKALLRGIHLTPDSFFSRLAGHKKDSMWSRVYKMIDNAQTKQLRIEMESNAIFREILKDQKYLRDITNTKNTYDVGLKDANGKPVLLTKDMLLTLYKHLQNEDNTRHIIVGGLNLPNLNSYYKNRENSYNGEERMPGFVGEELAAKYKQIEEESAALDDAWEVASINNDYEALARLEEKMNAMHEEADAIIRKGEKQARELLKNIEEQLDDKDRKFIEMSNEYFDEYSKNVLNEATMAMYGFEKAKVKNYFPIHVDSAFLKSSFDEIKKDFSLENSGFMKDRQKGAANPLYLEGFTTAVNQQIEKVARYAGLAPALKEFEKLYGVSEGGVTYNDSVKKAIGNVFGQAGTDYIEKLVADLNGNSRQKLQPWERFFQKARGRFAQGVLGVNAGVALKQRVSYLAAASELDYKSLSKALLIPEKGSFIFQGKQRRQNADELIAKWLPQLWKRSEGFIDVAMGEVRNVNQLRNRVNSKLNFLLGWIQASDISTVRRLWYASEYYVRDHTDLAPESDEYYRAVAEKYRDVIEKTQPNYTTLQRPAILRTNSEFIKSLTMFMTQRLQNFNIVYDSVLTANKYARDKKNGRNGVTKEDVSEARMRAYRAVSSQLGAAVGMAAINFLTGVVLFGRGKKWKDEDGEVTANSVLLGMLDDFLSSLCSNVVGGGEIYGIISSIVKGEKWKDGFSIGGLDTIEDAITSFSDALVKVRNGKELTSADWVKIGGNVCTMFGIPGSNAYKLARGLKNNLEGTIRGMEVDGELWELGATPERTDDQNGRRMLNAFLEGNDEKFENLEAEFGTKSKAEKAFIDALYEANRNGEITDDQVSDALEYIGYDDFDIGKVGEKFESNDLSAREEELYNEWKRGMSFDDAVKTLADEGHELSEWDQHVLLGEWTAKKETGAKSNFVWSEELDEALEGYMRDTSTGSNMKSVIKQYREWGCEDSKLDDRVGYLFRDKYKAAYRESKTKAAALNGRIIVMLTECGRTKEKAEDLVKQWEKDAAKK